ncbi:MAG: leucyl/phenylalanyl-tRNA--protein transferase [Lysobacter sp.]|nr:leucyl/phenylalanyl-tRNA--protein transferase [Lysobacter sp.]
MRLLRLNALPADPEGGFPDPRHALREPDGLLAMGGDLSPERLMDAYRHGIFPWYSDGEPLLWWCPDPRTVFRTDGVRLSSRFRRGLRRSDWVVRADTAFAAVLDACAQAPREGQAGTWITAQMRAAYRELHQLGHAHSIEVFDGAQLIGGLYGVACGRMFFGESMVSIRSGGSKVALAALAARLQEWGWPVLDAQVENPHLLSLGAELWPRDRFLEEVAQQVDQPGKAGSWSDCFGEYPAQLLADRGNFLVREGREGRK